MYKRSVCWNITSRCNSNCKFCYRDLCKVELEIKENLEIIKILAKIGIKKVTFSGGECLLYPNLIKLLKTSHEYNMKNSIITNGKLLNKENLREYEKYVDNIIFSIDALDEKINEKIGRGARQGKDVLDLMRYIENNNLNISMKLNTVVNKMNIGELENINNAIKDISIIRWKLFKFFKLRGKALKNSDEFSISNKEYEDAIAKMHTYHTIKKFKEKELENNYLLINSTGDFFFTEDSKDKIIGNYKNLDIEKVKVLLWN